MRAFGILIAFCAALALAGCSRGAPPATATATATTGDAAGSEATATSNGITLRASVMETQDLQASVAQGYGIAREPNQALLLLAVRDANGNNAEPTSLTATASNLKGGAQPLSLRAIRSGDFIDHIGLVPVSAPDTLTFEVHAQLSPGATSTLRFNREFYPR